MLATECKKKQSSFGRFGTALFFAVLLISLGAHTVTASTSDGTVDPTNRYAYSENSGWIDFGATGGNVLVTDSALTGYAYGENIGWISLNCSNTSSCATVNYAVSNDGSGNLGGYAYGENIGWVDFHPSGAGVTIDSSGVFHGSAYGENIGWITFNCADTSSCGTVNYTVSTDWRPASARNAGSGSSSGGAAPTIGGGGSLGPNYVWPTNSSTSIPTNFEPTSCPPGDLYSRTTGQRCSTVTSVASTSLPSLNISVFTRDLTIGSVGEDVRALQVFLNAEGFSVSLTGAGSKGNESTYFGAKTKAALARFQKAHGISPAVGYFGPITRAFIKSLTI